MLSSGILFVVSQSRLKVGKRSWRYDGFFSSFCFGRTKVLNEHLEYQEKYEIDLKKKTDEASSKVAIVLERAEDQCKMIESLHASVSPSTLQLSSPLQHLLRWSWISAQWFILYIVLFRLQCINDYMKRNRNFIHLILFLQIRLQVRALYSDYHWLSLIKWF